MRVFLCISMLMLSACASVPEPPTPVPDVTARAAFLASHPNWRIDGRVAYSHQGKGGSARMIWVQKTDHAEILLSAPLSMATVAIRLSADSAQIRDAEDKLLAEGTPSDVFMRILSSPVPDSGFAAGLRAYWPDVPESTRSALAGLVTIDGWQWRYLEWQDFPARLPKKIELTRGETRLRILIDDWQELPGE